MVSYSNGSLNRDLRLDPNSVGGPTQDGRSPTPSFGGGW
jgi:hypothetical protein